MRIVFHPALLPTLPFARPSVHPVHGSSIPQVLNGWLESSSPETRLHLRTLMRRHRIAARAPPPSPRSATSALERAPSLRRRPPSHRRPSPPPVRMNFACARRRPPLLGFGPLGDSGQAPPPRLSGARLGVRRDCILHHSCSSCSASCCGEHFTSIFPMIHYFSSICGQISEMLCGFSL